jgi:replicative DNA helicase
MITRALPQHLEAERTVLGACLLDRNAIIAAQELLKPGDFSSPGHRAIYSAMCDLTEDEERIDTISLVASLRGREQLELSGGVGYIAKLIDGLPRITNVEQWCALIIEASLRRALIHQADVAMTAAWDATQQIAVTLDSHHTALMRMMETREGRNDIAQGEALKEAQARIDRYVASQGVTGVPSGLEKLDQITGGWQPGTLVIIAARPACGKSTLCTQMAVFSAKAGFHVRAFTLEMSPAAVVERELLAEARVEKWRLRYGQKSEWAHLANAYGTLARLPITYDRRESPTAMQVRAACRRQQITGELDLVIVDYLQRLAIDEKLGDRAEQIGAARAAKALKSLALALKVPVIAACQLSRGAEGKEPTLADLRWSGDIEAEADIVIALHPDASTKAKDLDFPLTHLLMLKHREGACRRLRLTFEKRFTTFVAEIPRETEGKS